MVDKPVESAAQLLVGDHVRGEGRIRSYDASLHTTQHGRSQDRECREDTEGSVEEAIGIGAVITVDGDTGRTPTAAGDGPRDVNSVHGRLPHRQPQQSQGGVVTRRDSIPEPRNDGPHRQSMPLFGRGCGVGLLPGVGPTTDPCDGTVADQPTQALPVVTTGQGVGCGDESARDLRPGGEKIVHSYQGRPRAAVPCRQDRGCGQPAGGCECEMW